MSTDEGSSLPGWRFPEIEPTVSRDRRRLRSGRGRATSESGEMGRACGGARGGLYARRGGGSDHVRRSRRDERGHASVRRRADRDELEGAEAAVLLGLVDRADG